MLTDFVTSVYLGAVLAFSNMPVLPTVIYAKECIKREILEPSGI